MYKSLKSLILFTFIILTTILLFSYYFTTITNIQKEIIIKQLITKKEILNKQNTLLKQNINQIKEKIKREEQAVKIMTTVTAFNTVIYQTDNNPCIAKFGYICNRNDVVACPRNIPAHTKVKILNKEYECMDWLSDKYPNRFDISFDKDIQSAINWGKKYLEVTIYIK